MKNDIEIRNARRENVPHIVRLLANDMLDSQRECYQAQLSKTYYDAFDEINKDSNNHLIVVAQEHKIIGTLQLTIIPYLTSPRAGIRN